MPVQDIPSAEERKKLTKAFLTKDGKEILNPVPKYIMTDLERPLTLQEQIQRLQMKDRFEESMMEPETEEEAGDFEVESEFDSVPRETIYEMDEDPMFESTTQTLGESPVMDSHAEEGSSATEADEKQDVNDADDSSAADLDK